MITKIHSFVERYMHFPKTLEKFVFFLLLAWIWVITLRYVGLVISIAAGIAVGIYFPMETGTIAACSIFGLIAILHVIDIVTNRNNEE